ncbi:putative adp-ribosylation factor protein [Neofusicoccum parvum UCRNP2]|uniref:Putative adp-ribosylation factor protein n=1 Tax=Botryosphaeria parva (strain UCR-NP2) TaxID=1287680 RepID=R1GK22_BOTPV|nr:putative adp-ribosylation factor protein [Neofusicoccum parvum UCRNP2]
MAADSNHLQPPAAAVELILPDYYHSLGNDELLRSIRNLDDPKEFQRLQADVLRPNSRNFFVDFGDDHAWCAFDLSDVALKALMSKPTLKSLWKMDVRENHGTVQAVGTVAESVTVIVPGFETEEISLDQDFTKMISHYRLIDEVWHWSTVDEGRRYVSLGYNSLHSTPASRDLTSPLKIGGQEEKKEKHSDLPEGKRVWSWLVLCEDKTVINIHEDPFPQNNGYLDRSEHEILYSIRRNLLNVFRNLSKAFDPSRSAAIAILPIRRRIGDSDEERAHRPSDAPGLLFYNLFDDWFSTYSLVARREHKYAAALDKLRNDMMKKAELAHVDQLHCIGRQLSVLKRMYQSYEVIIDRVLEKQEQTLASLKNSHILALAEDGANGSMTLDDNASSNAHPIGEDVSMLGVALSSAARARFKRLKYRTRLYAISEIEECLSQKESLVMMNFNLIAIKESLSVERLTRVTLLLAKATLLFMPVSIMAAYFSCQFEGQEFTVRQFWTWFGVVVGVSLVGLFVFSFVSGTMEGKMLYKSMSASMMDMSKKWWGKKKSERAGRRALGLEEAGAGVGKEQ